MAAQLGTFFIAVITAIFIENTIFTRALGTSRLLAVANHPRTLFKFGMVLTIITTISGLLAWLANQVIKSLTFRFYIEPLVYVAVLTIVYFGVSILLSKLMPRFYSRIAKTIPLAVFNCATLGALLLPAHDSLTNQANLMSSLGFAFGTGIGFTLATVLVFEGIRKLEGCNIPRSFRGLPATLIYIGLLSLAFYGLIGHQLPF